MTDVSIAQISFIATIKEQASTYISMYKDVKFAYSLQSTHQSKCQDIHHLINLNVLDTALLQFQLLHSCPEKFLA